MSGRSGKTRKGLIIGESVRELTRMHAAASKIGKRVYLRQADQPKTRAECPTGPCPWVSCRHHLAFDVMSGGGLRHARPVDDPHMGCSLNMVDQHGAMTLQEIANELNLSHEGARVIEMRALAKLKAGLAAFEEEGKTLESHRTHTEWTGTEEPEFTKGRPRMKDNGHDAGTTYDIRKATEGQYEKMVERAYARRLEARSELDDVVDAEEAAE